MIERFEEKDALGREWDYDCLFDFVSKINDTWFHLHLAIEGFYPEGKTYDLVIKECADLANYAVILADIARRKEKCHERRGQNDNKTPKQ